MKKAMVFTYEEFEELVWEVTYNTVSIGCDMSNGWFWCVHEFSNEVEYEAWLENYGEEASEKLDDLYDDENDFVYRMIGKKFGAVVETIVVDVIGDAVAVIFE